MLGIFLVSVVCVALSSGQGNLGYDGGSISSYHVQQVNQTYMRMHIVALTGWQLGSNPCGTHHCDVREVNYTTSPLKPGPGTSGVSLGKWTVGTAHGSNVKTWDVTDYVKKHSVSYVIGISRQDGWELVATEFDYDVSMIADYTDITLTGPIWHPYLSDDRILAPASYLRNRLSTDIRNDTGIPNSTPVTIFKPVYRLPLNRVSFISLVPVDPDGDAVTCENAVFVSAGGVKVPTGITIHKDCRIEVPAFESMGYKDGGWDALVILVSDYNQRPIAMGRHRLLRPYLRHLGQQSIQFLIHTVATIVGPSFIDPTPANRHVFVVEVDALLNVVLAAHGNSPVKTFHVSSIPSANVNLTSVTPATGQVAWRPTHEDIGTYVMQVRVTDIYGAEGEERTFVIHVRDRKPFSLLTDQAYDCRRTKPGLQTGRTGETHRLSSTGKVETQFAYIPHIATSHCIEGDTCIFAVPVLTSFQVASVIGRKGVSVVEWQGPYLSTASTQRYQVDTKIENLLPGLHSLCLTMGSPYSTIQRNVCFNVRIDYKDPCEKMPCLHFGECVAFQGKFTCHCQATYTGSVCEKMIDVCSPSPCVHGKCHKTPGGLVSYFCQCDPGFSGTKCETSTVNVATTSTSTATPSTTTVTLTTTTVTTPTTTVTTPTTTVTTPTTTVAPRVPTTTSPAPTTLPTTTVTPTTTTLSAATTTGLPSTTPDQSTAATVCMDKPGINCGLLNTTVYICKAAVVAEYCSFYCGDCPEELNK